MTQDVLDKPFLPLDRLRILKYFSAYSVIITTVLISLYFLDLNLGFLGVSNPKMYPLVLALHASLTFVFLALAFSSGQTHYDHLIAFFLLDITLVAGLIYSSGSGNSLSYLMIVAIAVGNSIVTGQKGLLLSAWATICLVYIESRFAEQGLSYNFMNAGTLGFIFFVTAFAIQTLVKKLHLSVDINRLQADNLLSMEQLTKLVLKRLETGVIVVNEKNDIIFQNSAAQTLLGFPGPIWALPEKLQLSLQEYLKFPNHPSSTFKVGPTSAKIQPMFVPLMPGTKRGTVIFIEDTNVVYQQAQRLKQVSLGKLAASIVREIKHPMDNVFKIALQLSQASLGVNNKEQQALIKGHSQHIDRIIKNVQNLGNTKATRFEKLRLGEWVTHLVKRQAPKILKGIKVELKVSRHSLDVCIDSSQIRQALTGLLENAAYYARQRSADFSRVSILVGRNKSNGKSVIEISDNGYGVELDDLDHIFEPFYSSESNKSGLGLYLAKQFCEMNMAQLDYVSSQQGARFRITFPSSQLIENTINKRENFTLRENSSIPASA